MSDDMNKKIKEIADMLGQDNIPDNVKSLISLLANGGNSNQEKKNDPSDEAVEVSPEKEQKRDKSEIEDNMEMLRKVKTVMDRLNNTNDPRVNLLTAVKPFLSGKRQKKLGTCIRMIQMSGLTKLIEGPDKSTL